MPGQALVRPFCLDSARSPTDFALRRRGQEIQYDHRGVYAVESIVPSCRYPPTYFRHRAQRIDPTSRSVRPLRDDDLRVAIQRVRDATQQIYGPRKAWGQLRRESHGVARCTVWRAARWSA